MILQDHALANMFHVSEFKVLIAGVNRKGTLPPELYPCLYKLFPSVFAIYARYVMCHDPCISFFMFLT